MTHSADFQEISILIPGYSIEDLPSDLNERNAASLLNAFAVAWHPWLLHRSARIPEFRQAESTELPTGQHLILVPECSEDWLGHDWQEKLSDTLSVVFHGCGDRDEWTKAIDDEFGVAAEAIPESLLADFFALGTTHLQVLLLSRRMHHFVDPDGHLLESEAFAAAEAAITGDEAKAQDHLRRCFECLLDCREQFYPVDCFLVDMCLPSDQTMAADLQSLISESPSLSLVCSGHELRSFCAIKPDFAATLKSALESERLSLLTGHQNELRISLGGLSAAYSDIRTAQNWLRQHVTDKNLHWARRRFGMTSSLPSLLSLFNFVGALHVVLDDGLYPGPGIRATQLAGPGWQHNTLGVTNSTGDRRSLIISAIRRPLHRKHAGRYDCGDVTGATSRGAVSLADRPADRCQLRPRSRALRHNDRLYRPNWQPGVCDKI